ncbi:class I SAM-dependent methyltransferase [Desulfogranum japonicum]|uniref:class I SAM-dependent methyltransferase n=1 Tax=Desulfogranum japonicum TaxID=231447 RepID=UPI00040632C8|nr:class I SAM-dependent methyltransferase [Desulfogranum japonicum]
MGDSKKFDPKKIHKLTDPSRKKFQDPALIWQGLGKAGKGILVDIGAGAGFFAVPFSQQAAVHKVYACDTSEPMIAWMQENLEQDIRTKVEIVPSSENHVPLQDALADLVYMINLHHELDAPVQMLEECKRLLKPEGTLLIIDWKKKAMEMGPPEKIRIAEQTVQEQLLQTGFHTITNHDMLPYHYMLTAVR